MTESKKFLFVWWDGGGNMPPVLHLVRQLRTRGHKIHVLGDPSSEEAFREAGATFTPFRRAPHRMDLRPENDPLRDWEARNPKQNLENIRDRLLFGPAAGYAEDTLEQIIEYRPDALGIMDFTFGAMVAAERARIPAAVIAPHILAYPVPGRPPFGPGFLPARSAVERLRDRVVAGLSEKVLKKGLPAFNSVRRRFGLEPVTGVFEQVHRMTRVLVLTSPALELPGGPLPDNVRYVGPVLADPAWAAPWSWHCVLEKREPLVLLSFSTTFQNQKEALRRAIDALGQLAVRALVTVGPALRREDFNAPANVVIRKSAPHSQVLPHVDAMITHAGHGSVVRALAHGVPLVCVPMGRDQNDIAARVVYHGAGVRLSASAQVGQFTDAVKKVLDDTRFCVSAARLGEAIRRDAEKSTAIVELERLAGCRDRTGRLDRDPVLSPFVLSNG
jgi:MGT family glycosyltransferase